MIRQPFTLAELGIDDESLARAASELERYAEQTRLGTPPVLVASILDAVEAEPAPRRGWLGGLGARGGILHRSMAMGVTAAVLAAAVGVGFLFGRLVDGPAPDVGTSPPPSVMVTPSPTPTLTATPTPTPTPSPSFSPAATSSSEASESPGLSAEPSASESDDSGGNSGPGGGGDDNSGPGGGG